MMSPRYVSTAKELKKALDDKADWIIITDRKLAFAARVIKKIGYKSLASLAALAGVAAENVPDPFLLLFAFRVGVAVPGLVRAFE